MDKIMEHLKLTFVAEKPPPAQAFRPIALMTAEESGEYEQRGISRGEAVCRCSEGF